MASLASVRQAPGRRCIWTGGSRTPVSLHHLIVADNQRKRCIGGHRRRGRAQVQRRHFTQALKGLGGHRPHPPSAAAATVARSEANPLWQPPALENPAFEEYYKEQGIVREEWDAFMSVLRKPLPAMFRINASCQFFKDIFPNIENDFRRSLESEVSDEYGEDAIKPLPQYAVDLKQNVLHFTYDIQNRHN